MVPEFRHGDLDENAGFEDEFCSDEVREWE